MTLAASKPAYDWAARLAWDRLAKPLVDAEDAIARLDERLAKSPIAEGFVERSHFGDACASLWVEGELVHVEDVVLHDALMDARRPTHELIRAHAVLRARRRIARAKAGWALTAPGLDALRGRGEAAATDGATTDDDWDAPRQDENDAWTARLAEIDRVVARTESLLAGKTVETRPATIERPTLVYDLDWNEDERISAWLRVVRDTSVLPPSLAAALSLDAWAEIDPLQTQGWLGRLLGAEILRSRAKTRSLCASVSVGLKAAPIRRRWTRDRVERVVVYLEALTISAREQLKSHDQLILIRDRFERRLKARRRNSTLPALVALMFETPVASSALIARRLSVTPRAAMMLAQELGLRETTGRRRYRAWSIS
jgi:hypothetical protein